MQPGGSNLPPRNPRSGRMNAKPAQRPASPAHPPKKKRKKPSLFTGFELTVLLVLLAGVVIAFFSGLQAKNAMNTLLDLRAAEERAYQENVQRHKVVYEDTIRYYAAVNQIDPAFVAAVIKRESDYDPFAVSRVEARGLMQIMPDTGEWLAGKVNVHDFSVDLLFDPEINIKMGCWYLGYLSRKFGGDPVTIACAYHAGQGNVEDHWLKKYSANGKTLTIEEIPLDDTKYYARKVLEAYAIYQQHHY